MRSATAACSCSARCVAWNATSSRGARKPVQRGSTVVVAAGKGFGDSGKTPKPADAAPATASDGAAATPLASASSPDGDDVIEALEARMRSRRQRAKVEPKVAVQSATVAQATGQAPATPAGALETAVVQLLGGFFVLIIAEGLVLAASGLLPEALDAAVQDYLYPSYSPTLLLFLGCSSLYGLWKTGKLPGQQQL